MCADYCEHTCKQGYGSKYIDEAREQKTETPASETALGRLLNSENPLCREDCNKLEAEV
jgi:hypothetical protein